MKPLITYSGIFILFALLVSCSSEEEYAENFTIRIVDEFDQPFADVPVELSYSIGCTYYGLDRVNAVTDAGGMAQFTTHVDPDTITNLLGISQLDPSNVHQAIHFEYNHEIYTLWDIQQEGRAVDNIFRPVLRPDEVATVRLIKYGQIEFVTNRPLNEEEFFKIEHAFEGEKGVLSFDRKWDLIFWPGEGEVQALTVPGNTDIDFEWSLYAVDRSENTTFIKSGSLADINIPEGGKLQIEIQVD